MSLIDWAQRHNIPRDVFNDLVTTLSSVDCTPPPADPDKLASEARVQSLVRLEAARAGVVLTRNNVGAFRDPETGSFVRFGLWNETKAQNKTIKSADLIGFRKRVISPCDVGNVIAQFVAREVKKEGWTKPTNEREHAQVRFRDFINANGGDAAIVSGPGSFNHQTR